MMNYNSPIVQMQNMINNGGFGYSNPVDTNQPFNPYNSNQFMTPPVYSQPTNMLSFGGMNYNQQVINNNGYSFSPVGNGYDMPYNNQQFSPYQQNYYGGYYGNQYYGYNQPQQYGELSPFLFAPNPVQTQSLNDEYYRAIRPETGFGDIKQRMININKTKAAIVNSYFGMENDPKKIEAMFEPPKDNRTPKEIQRDKEYFKVLQYDYIFKQPPVGIYETNAMKTARCIADMSRNFHEQFDHVGFVEFYQDHLWKFQREEFIRNNINFKSNRDLSGTYHQNSYNELLNLHKSSTNPYLNDLLDNSKYDNNLDDMEIGLPSVLLDAEMRKRNILEGRVPTFISDPATQQQRQGWISKVMEQARIREQQQGRS